MGGKGVGSQGDGTAQFVVRSLEDRQIASEKIHKAFPDMRCFPLTIRGTNQDKQNSPPISVAFDTAG